MLLSVFLMAAPSAAAEKPGIAVTEVKAVHGIEPSLAQVLNEVLLARLKDSGVFSSVIGGSDIAAMVDMEQQKAALGCDDTNCLAELGGALGVPYLMDSTISKVGGQFVVTLKILAVEEAKVLARKVAMVADEAGLIPSFEKIIPEALAAMPQNAEPAPAASAAQPAAKAAPKTTAEPVASPSKRARWAVSAVGFGGLVGGLWLLEQVRTTHEEQKALPTYDVDANRARQSTAQSLIVGGLVVGGAGAAWAALP